MIFNFISDLSPFSTISKSIMFIASALLPFWDGISSIKSTANDHTKYFQIVCKLFHHNKFIHLLADREHKSVISSISVTGLIYMSKHLNSRAMKGTYKWGWQQVFFLKVVLQKTSCLSKNQSKLEKKTKFAWGRQLI